MKETGEGMRNVYVALHAINYRFPFTEKQEEARIKETQLSLLNFSWLLVHFLASK